jgi:hypothetical protein
MSLLDSEMLADGVPEDLVTLLFTCVGVPEYTSSSERARSEDPAGAVGSAPEAPPFRANHCPGLDEGVAWISDGLVKRGDWMLDGHKLVGPAIAVLLITPLIALADTRTMRDANDAKGPMDIQSITQSHKMIRLDTVGHYQQLLVHEFKTFAPWRDSEVKKSVIRFLFGVKNEWSRTLVIKRADGNLYGKMQGNHGQTLGYARVVRPGNRSLRVIFPKALLKRGTDRYRWSVNIQPRIKAHPNCFDTSTDVVVRLCIDTAGFMYHHV